MYKIINCISQGQNNSDFQFPLTQINFKQMKLKPHDRCQMTLTTDSFVVRSPVHSWKYEMRHEMQQVLPNLFIGPLTSACNLQRLKDRNIKNVVLVRTQNESNFMKPLFQEICYFEIETPPADFAASLIPKFQNFKNYIEQQNERTLVVCFDGISLSPVIVASYLMHLEQIPYDAAVHQVQRARFCSHFREHQICQLKEYEPIISLKTQYISLEPSVPVRTKRAYSE